MSVHTMETLALFDSAPYQNAFSARVIAVSEQGIALSTPCSTPPAAGNRAIPATSPWPTAHGCK